MTKRNLYLNNTPVEEAKKIYIEALSDLFESSRKETVPVIESLDRVSADAVYARYSSPLYNCAAMDGIMLESSYTRIASEELPLMLEEGRYEEVDTGDPIRPPFDAVIMAEDLIEKDESLEIISPAHPWQHVRPIGEDIVATELIIPTNHQIRPMDIGVLLSGGITEIDVYAKLKVGIMPTGTEMVEPSDVPQIGDIIESNSRVFEGLVKQNGALPCRVPPVKDDYETLKSEILELSKTCDLIIINAGSSAGREDFTSEILKEIGQVFVHGVAMKPGKPAILARIKDIPVIGIPGYPVSAYLVFEEFVAPLLRKLGHLESGEEETIEAISTRRIVSSLKHQEYVRVKIGNVDGKFVATPLSRGAGAAMSLVRSDGFCIIPQNSEGVDANETINVKLVRKKTELNQTIVSIGSHDMILDVLNDIFGKQGGNLHLSSSHVGSLAGLMSLKKGECHMAPTHLLSSDGSYNIANIKSMITEPVALVKGVSRTQGLIVQKGNPLNIKGLADLERATYINRQRGAGTRVLLDYKLEKLKLDKSKITGYEREATTHMAVAAAVKSNTCDCGLGVYSAARALDLDFVPVGEEEYDFAIMKKYMDMDIIKNFISTIKSDEFKKRLEQLGGYGYQNTGEVIIID
ncbi:MAG: molybdopterin biosynthesis protein [Proteocatella sp.]